MKKVCLAVREPEAYSCVSSLRNLGLLHVEHQQLPAGKDIASLQENISLINEAILIISQKELSQITQAEGTEAFGDWRHLARHIIDTQKRIEHLIEYSRTLIECVQFWQAWGDFSPQEIQDLRQKGIFVKLYEIPERQLNEAPEDIFVHKVFSAGGISRCLAAGRKDFSLPFQEISMPNMGLSEMKHRLADDKKSLGALKQEIGELARFKHTLLGTRKALQVQLEFQQVLKGMGYAPEVAYVAGYIPFDAVDRLTKLARKESWGMLISEPCEDDNVPVFIRNPRWITLINPVFKFLEILPGYRELDISLPFLVFFSIFFGMLIGDAGYGLVYLFITFLIQRKMRGKVKQDSSFSLFYLLSFCAIIWGALTGIFFGQEWVLKAGYKPLLPALNDEKGIQRFCFFLGALHLSIAHGWRGILKSPSLSALGDLGWMCVLWGAFFIAKTLILGDAFPSFCVWLLILGATLIIIFTNPQKNILKSAEEWISWLITLPFSFIGNFADVVSYIRLFAVGLAGVAIADAFNAMAAMIGQGNMLMIALAVVVALIGNALGVILGPVSVLVHGIRLNLLEFSGHMGLSWSGAPYKPLKE